MKAILSLTAAAETATGLLLLAYPPVLVRWLFGAELSGVGTVMSRIAGMALIGLGISCWPSAGMAGALRGMTAYSALAAVYLTGIAFGGQWVGKLLWPAAAIHGIVTAVLVRAWICGRTIATLNRTKENLQP